ncbi:MAG: hypothetical protein QM723_36655 [Myxococcaceae bacterium]
MSALDSLRIRLEGGLETIEHAIGDYDGVRRLLGRGWHYEVDVHRDAFVRVAAHEEQVLNAVEKLQTIRDAAGTEVLRRFHQARGALLERVRKLEVDSGVAASSELASGLEVLLTLARSPGSSPVFFCRAYKGLTRVWLGLFTGCLRLSGAIGDRELPLSHELIRDGGLGRIEIRGVGVLVIGSRSKADLLTIGQLLLAERWPPTVEPPADHLVIPAVLRRSRATGALFVCERQGYFLHDGSRAFDVVAQRQWVWRRPRAATLAWALLRLPRVLRESLVGRLEVDGSLVALGLVDHVRKARGTITFGPQVDIDAVGAAGRELSRWLKR